MSVLVILCGHEFDPQWRDNIKTMGCFFGENAHFCGISNKDDFHHYEDLVAFQYKIINPKGQWSKVCDFITDHSSELSYDWFVKIRPDFKLLAPIDWDKMRVDAMNARARVYHGPDHIPHGTSIKGEGRWKNINDIHYDERVHDVVLDDQCFIFHQRVVKQNGLAKVNPEERENEWFMTQTLHDRGIALNVVGIHAVLSKYNCFSGDIP
jgi:hypothetical protein